MATMSRKDMRDFVREHVDSDEEELPNSLLDRFLQDASTRIDNYSRTWSFRAVEYDLEVVSGTQSYDLDSEPSLIVPGPLRDIVDVRGPSSTLRPTDHRAERARRSPSSGTGTPAKWSVWGRSLYLWPSPSASDDYTVVGYREGADWITTNATPDFPEPFHELIAWWALNRAYAFLDDPEMSSFYRDEFAMELRGRAKHYQNVQDAAPFVMGGGERSINGLPATLGPLRWPVLDV